MKKITSILTAVVMLFVMATPSFAWVWPVSDDEATVKSFAMLHNDLTANLSTGFNVINSAFKGGTILSGAAEAIADIKNTLNTNTIGCNCYDDLTVKSFAGVHNDVSAQLTTGYNTINGGFFGSNAIGSGTAAAMGLVTNVINTNIIGD